MRSALLASLLIAPLLAEEEGSLSRVAEGLNQGIRKVLDGTEVAKAFSPWKADAEDEEKLRAAVQDAGIIQAKLLGFEIELILTKSGAPVYKLRTFVAPDGALIALSGRARRRYGSDEVVVKGSIVREECVEDLAPFAETADRLIAALKGDSWKDVKFADSEAVHAGIQTEEGRKELAAQVEKAKEHLEEIHVAVREIDSDGLRVLIGGMTFLGYDSAGEQRGILRGRLRAGDGGKLVVSLGLVKASTR